MTHEEVMQMLSELDIPFAYDHFAEGESPDPPFICFLFPGSENFSADNVVYMGDLAALLGIIFCVIFAHLLPPNPGCRFLHGSPVIRYPYAFIFRSLMPSGRITLPSTRSVATKPTCPLVL